MFRRRSPLLAAAVLSAAAPGCISMDGCDVRSPTIGQELIDLKAAHDGGVLTWEEFDAKRFELLHPDGGGAVRVGG